MATNKQDQEKWLEKKLGKQVVAVSGLKSGSYLGITIMETPQGFSVMLEGKMYSSSAITSITAFIDSWFETKKN